MDSISQAVLGAGVQMAMLGKVQKRKAAVYGALLATLPDLDVLWRFPDPVSNMTYHRGFSHSIFVLTLFSVLLAWLIRRYRPNPAYSGMKLWLTLWLVLITHVLLDAMTVYGTQLFWPLNVTPVSLPAVFIVDVWFTLPLLLVFVWGLWGGVSDKVRRYAVYALSWGVVYLAIGTAARLYCEHRVVSYLEGRGVVVTEVKGMPLPLSNLLWRVVVKSGDDDYYDAVSGVFDTRAPEVIKLTQNRYFDDLVEEQALFRRLRWFTGNWLRIDFINDEVVVSDLRMGTPGKLYFQFVFMRQDDEGNWNNVTPERYHPQLSVRHGEQLRRIRRRIFHQDPPLPLEKWQSLEYVGCVWYHSDVTTY